MIELDTHGADETERLAQRLGGACRGGELFVLSGELGSGKTCFVRGLARGLGCDAGAVRSPSFTLLFSYAGRLALHHYDVYFTAVPIDLERAGLAESLAAGDVAAVEWGERLASTLPADRVVVALEHVAESVRRVRVQAAGPRARELLVRAGLGAGGRKGEVGP